MQIGRNKKKRLGAARIHTTYSDTFIFQQIFVTQWYVLMELGKKGLTTFLSSFHFSFYVRMYSLDQLQMSQYAINVSEAIVNDDNF